jgi:hypothetical protein
MCPDLDERVSVALRVLNACVVAQRPDPPDVAMLHRIIGVSIGSDAPDDLARLVIAGELAREKIECHEPEAAVLTRRAGR